MMSTGSIAAAALLLWGAPLGAQELSVALQGGEISDETGAVRTGATVAPELRWLSDAWSGRLGASGTLFTDGALIAGAVAEADGALWSAGALSLVMGGAASGAASDAGYTALSLGVSPGVRIGAGSWMLDGRALLRAAGEAQPAERAWRGFLPLSGESMDARMTWRRAHGAAATLSGSAARIQGRVGWSRMALEAGVAWTDWTAAAGARLGPLDGTVEVGRRAGVGAGDWVALSASIPVSRSAALTGSVGTNPSDPLTGRASGRFAMVGLRVRVAGSETGNGGVRMPPPVPAGATRLTVRAAPGSRVELMGDWSGWQAQPVPETAPGEFTREVVLGPGVYRFAFRVDGRWTLPGGYATEADEYGGRRAVLRVSAPGDEDTER